MVTSRVKAVVLGACFFCHLLAPPVLGNTPDPASLPRVAKILVEKSDRKMFLFDKNGNVVRSYPVSLGKVPKGNKEKEGDNRTPEGRYYIDARNPNSAYHLSLRLSYPSPFDIRQARKIGYTPGSDIFIHGQPNGKADMDRYKIGDKNDWTNGCIAVADTHMREIWEIVPDGTPVTIVP